MILKHSKIFKKSWHYVFFAVIALITLYIDAYVSKTILDGDASLMMYRGYLVATKGLAGFAEIWDLNEARLFDISLFFIPFFKLFSNWTLVRFCGTSLIQALYVLSFFYLMTQLGLSKKTKWITAGLILLPFSTTYARIILYHLHYCVYIIYIFLLLGLLFRLLNLKAEESHKRLPILCAFGLLWIVVGLNGVRHMMILLMPLLVLGVVHMLQLLKGYTFVDRRLSGEKPIDQHPETRLLGLLILSCAFFLIGFVINQKFLSPILHLSTYTNERALSFTNHIDRFKRIFDGLLISIGSRNVTAPVLSARSASLMLALFSFGYLFWASWQRGIMLRTAQENHCPRRIVSGLVISSLIITTFIFYFDVNESLYCLYYMPVLVLVFPVLATEVEALWIKTTSAARKLLIYLTCFAFLFQGVYTTVYLLNPKATTMDNWDGLYYTDRQTVQHVQDCVDFMLTSGYTHGLIDYWYANVMVELSDAQLAIAPAWGADAKNITSLTSRSAFTTENLPMKLIVFLTPDAVPSFTEEYPNSPVVFTGKSFVGLELETSRYFKDN